MPRLLFIDNYDSFSWNLIQAFHVLGAEVEVIRNDEVTPSHLEDGYQGVVFSPGPGNPRQAGRLLELVACCLGRLPLLGVCLGHQALVEVMGGQVVRAPVPIHGKATDCFHGGEGCFRGMDSPLQVGRYHSLVVERSTLPRELVVTAWSTEGVILGVRHTHLHAEGVQFHPESVLTPRGPALLKNWLTSLTGFKSEDPEICAGSGRPV